jgi:hypothetical protein
MWYDGECFHNPSHCIWGHWNVHGMKKTFWGYVLRRENCHIDCFHLLLDWCNKNQKHLQAIC